MRTNSQRAGAARRGLDRYYKEEFGETALKDSVLEERALDLLTDLLHLCARESMDIDSMIERATDHWVAELAEERASTAGKIPRKTGR